MSGPPTNVGDDLRALRRLRRRTLSDLSSCVGRSVGWLSEIERGQAQPSVHDLGRLAAELGVTIGFFFRSASRDAAERGLVQRAADRIPIGSPATGLEEELLSPGLGGGFEMIRSVFAPRADSGGPVPSRGGEHGGVVLSGALVLVLNGREVQLGAGDSFQFSGHDYVWRNETDEPTVVIWVVAPPVY